MLKPNGRGTKVMSCCAQNSSWFVVVVVVVTDLQAVLVAVAAVVGMVVFLCMHANFQIFSFTTSRFEGLRDSDAQDIEEGGLPIEWISEGGNQTCAKLWGVSVVEELLLLRSSS